MPKSKETGSDYVRRQLKLKNSGVSGTHSTPYYQTRAPLTSVCRQIATLAKTVPSRKLVSLTGNMLLVSGKEGFIFDITKLEYPEMSRCAMFSKEEIFSRALATVCHKVVLTTGLYYHGNEQVLTMILFVEDQTFIFIVPKDAIVETNPLKIKNSGIRGAHAKQD